MDGSVVVPQPVQFNMGATGAPRQFRPQSQQQKQQQQQQQQQASGIAAKISAKPQQQQVLQTIGSVDASKDGQHDLTFSGGVLIDKKKLMQNIQAQSQASSKAALPPAAPAISAAMGAEIASLLARRSRHADEADDEWFESYGKRLDAMAKKESQQDHVNNQHALSVKAFLCKSCKSHTEHLPALCKQQGHVLVPVTALKRFFACQSCRNTSFTLGTPANNQLPKHPCLKCSQFAWVPCGYQGKPTTNQPLNGQLVLAASDYGNRHAGIDLLNSRESQL
jgi:hypothetical protein